MGHLFFSISVVFLCFIGYLQPFHSAPWPSAINDGVFVILGLICIAYNIIIIKQYKLSFSFKEIFVICLIAVHIALSTIFFENRSVWPYILVLTISFLCYKNEIKYPISKNYLIVGIWLSAIVTTIIGIGQWLGVWHQFEGRFLWMLDVNPGTRLAGNLGQPNITGTLLVWGIACALIISEKIETKFTRIISRQIAYGLLSASTFLMTVASVLTQSRTTTLGLFAITLIAWKFKSIYGVRAFWTTVAVCVLHVGLSILLPYINQFLFASELTTAYGGKGVIDNSRLSAYLIFICAILERPIFGFGVGGVVSAFIDGVEVGSGLGTYFAHTHNLILEFLVWFGIPIGLMFVFILFNFLYLSYTKIKTTNDVALFSMLLMVVIHSMLEFPLHYVYFLVPTAIFAANFSRPSDAQSLTLPRAVISSVILILGLISVFLINEYLRFEKDIRQARLELGITGRAHPPADAGTIFLNELNGANVMIRTEVSSEMPVSQLRLFENTTTQFPMRPFIQKNIEAATLNGQTDKANYWRNKYCAIYGVRACESILPVDVR